MITRAIAVLIFCVGIFCLTQQPRAQITLLGVNISGGTPVLTFKTSATSSSTASATIDFGTLTYGTCNRVVVGTFIWSGTNGADNVSSISINGTGGTQILASQSANNNNEIWETTGAPSGTSGDIQITWGAASAGSTLSVVGLFCLVTTHPTVSSTAEGANSFGTSVTVSSALTVPSSGGGAVMTTTQNTETPTPVSFTKDVQSSSQTTFGHTTVNGSVSPGFTLSSNDAMYIQTAAWGP